NPGTMAAPMKTINAAMATATSGSTVRDLYLDRGVYSESVTMLPGVSIFGGDDSTTGGARSFANVSEIAGAPAVRASATIAAEIQLVKLTGLPTSNGTSYGVFANGATLTFRNDTICASDGRAGAKGQDGLLGTPGGFPTKGESEPGIEPGS